MNDSHAKGVFDETKGKLKQAFGDATGDHETAASGVVDQVKGNAEQTWGNVKDAAHDLHHSDAATETRVRTEETGHDIGSSIARGAEHLKDSIARGLDDLKHKVND